ncbi:MAG: DUF177 domain-containing protein [Acidobacteriota bacterium]|nr:DUF177 domain-containing protein [Acidobacteriota bacterium]MDQ7086757.1 DUF177 domain-containing protein [Acidobacteriota bacterium]
MLFDISELGPTGVSLDERVDVPAFEWSGGDRVEVRKVRIRARLAPTRRGIEVQGEYAARVGLHCSRCLEAVEKALEGDFRLYLQPVAGEEAEESTSEQSTRESDVDLFPVVGKQVDLAALLREQIDLALPVKVLCRDDCRGLCASCGANLNQVTCRCGNEAGGGMSALADLARKWNRNGRGEQDPPGGK